MKVRVSLNYCTPTSPHGEETCTYSLDIIARELRLKVTEAAVPEPLCLIITVNSNHDLAEDMACHPVTLTILVRSAAEWTRQKCHTRQES